MTSGDIVLARLQQSDGRIKNRPVLLLTLMRPYGDFLVCGISSQLRQEVIGFDEIISANDSDFGQSGLKVTSLVRLGMVATISKSSALGQIGSISPERLVRLRSQLAHYIEAEQTGK